MTVHDIQTAQTAQTARREVAVTRLWGSVHQLLEQRDDLVGTHPMADLIHDAVRWTA